MDDDDIIVENNIWAYFFVALPSITFNLPEQSSRIPIAHFATIVFATVVLIFETVVSIFAT